MRIPLWKHVCSMDNSNIAYRLNWWSYRLTCDFFFHSTYDICQIRIRRLFYCGHSLHSAPQRKKKLKINSTACEIAPIAGGNRQLRKRMLNWAGRCLQSWGGQCWEGNRIISYVTNAGDITQLSLVPGPSSSSGCQILLLQAAFALSYDLEATK